MIVAVQEMMRTDSAQQYCDADPEVSETGIVTHIKGHLFALINADQHLRDGVFIEKSNEEAGAFGGRVAEDGDGFHDVEICRFGLFYFNWLCCLSP